MKHFTRRDFIHAGCTVASATLVPNFLDQAEAGLRLHGVGSGLTPNNNRVTINVGAFYLNLAKGWNLPSQDPTLLSSDGYFISTPASGPVGAFPFPSGYFDQYFWSWTGTASMQLPNPAIIYDGGAFVGLGTNTGQVTANLGIINKANPSVSFKFGALITAVSGGSGSLVTITTTALNFGNGFSNNSQVKLGIGVSPNLANGNNPDGSWTITPVGGSGGTQFTLNNSTGVVSPSITNTGVVGTNSEAVLGNFALNAVIVNSGTFSGWGNLIVCRLADKTDVQNGVIWDNTYVSQLKTLFNNASASPSTYGWLRFMDLIGVQQSFECDFSQRIPKTYIAYGAGYLRSGYWTSGGSITNGGTDNYTCTDPSVSTLSGGAYLDNAIVQGTISGASTGRNATLAVGTGPTKPVFNYGDSTKFIQVTAGATTPGTDVLQFTFQAAYLAGLPGVVGTTYTKNYTTVSGDNNASTLGAHLQAAFASDTTLAAANIFFTGSVSINAPTAQAGRLTVTYASGTATCSVNTMNSTISNGVNRTFIYNYILDGWIMYPGPMICSIPFEAIVELCSRVGAHCWFTWPVATKSSWVTAVTQFFGDSVTGLPSGVRFGTEVGNEVWNPGAEPYPFLQILGQSFGWSLSSQNSIFSYTALRTKQYQALSSVAWTGKGRVASDHYIFNMAQVGDNGTSGPFATYQLNGTSLVTSNSNYNLYSGLNGTGAVASYNSSPNRPVDITTAIGCAPYWGSKWMSGAANDGPTGEKITGPVSENTPWLQAAQDYANGLASTAFTSMANQFNGTTTRPSGSAGSVATFANYATHFTNQEALASNYDAGRPALGLAPLGIIHYEGGPQWAIGNSPVNGVNSVNNTDINALVSAMTALSWTTTQLIPYTLSGTGNMTECATQVFTMLQAWKYDSTYDSLIKANYYQILKNTSAANREAKPAQYGYVNNQWCLFPANIFVTGSQYQNYNAISEWNAGS